MVTRTSFATVLFDFDTEEADELSVRAGELVELLHPPHAKEEDWVWVKSAAAGSQGQVPASYLSEKQVRPLSSSGPPLPSLGQRARRDEGSATSLGADHAVAPGRPGDHAEAPPPPSLPGPTASAPTTPAPDLPAVAFVPLPAGWSEEFDEGTGLPFYYNEVSGISTWEPPDAAADAALLPAPAFNARDSKNDDPMLLKKQLLELQEVLKAQSQRLEERHAVGITGQGPATMAAAGEVSSDRPSRPLWNPGDGPSPLADARLEGVSGLGSSFEEGTFKNGLHPRQARIQKLEAEAEALRSEREQRERDAQDLDAAAAKLQARWRGKTRAQEPETEAVRPAAWKGRGSPAPARPGPGAAASSPGKGEPRLPPGGLDGPTMDAILNAVEQRFREDFQLRDRALLGLQAAIEELSHALQTPSTPPALPPIRNARPQSHRGDRPESASLASSAGISPAPESQERIPYQAKPPSRGAQRPSPSVVVPAPAVEQVIVSKAHRSPVAAARSVKTTTLSPLQRRLPAPGFSRRGRSKFVRTGPPSQRQGRWSQSPGARGPKGAATMAAGPQSNSPAPVSGRRTVSPDSWLPRVAHLTPQKEGERSAVEVQRGEYLEHGVRYSACRSVVYPPSALDGADLSALEAAPAPAKQLVLDYVHGYNGDPHRPIGTAHGTNAHWLSSGELVFPASATVVIFDYVSNTQRFFLGHDADVNCVAVHPTLDVVASGQDSRHAKVCLFDAISTDDDVVATASPADLGGGPGVGVGRIGSAGIRLLSQTLLGRNGRGVAALDFSPDGLLLLAVTNDDYHSVSVQDWRLGHVLCVARSNNAAVYGMKWHPVCFQGVHEADYPEEVCYPLVSCGVRHIKFWTLSRREDVLAPPLPALVRGAVYTNVGRASEFAHFNPDGPDEPPPAFLRQDSRTRDWLGSGAWRLEGKQGSFSRFESVDITCLAFTRDRARDDLHSVAPASRVLAGTGTGDLMVWLQPADADGIWQPRGKVLSNIPGMHAGAITDIAIAELDGGATRLATAGRDGRVVTWRLGPAEGRRSDLPLSPERVAYSGGVGVGVGAPRSLCFDAAAQLLAVGTVGNAVCLFDADSEAASPAAESAIIGADASIVGMQTHLLLQGHHHSCRALATHPARQRFVTVGGDRTVRLWDSEAQRLISTARLSERTTAVAFSPDGDSVAVGTDHGDVVVLQFNEDDGAEGGRWEVVAHRGLARRRHSSRSPERSAKGAQDADDAADSAADDDGAPDEGAAKAATIMDLKFSPDGEVLAAACRDTRVNLLSVGQGYRRMASCKGHSTIVTAVDFSADSKVLRSNDAAHEVLHWDVATGKQISSAFGLRDLTWDSWTCVLGWPVQGIWNVPQAKRPLCLVDGGRDRVERAAEVQTVSVNRGGDLLAVGDDAHRVMLLRYPCLPGAQPSPFAMGHMSKVTCTRFGCDDAALLSCGGADACVLQWRLAPYIPEVSESTEASLARTRSPHNAAPPYDQ